MKNLLTIDEPNVRKEPINSLKDIIKQICFLSEVENYVMEFINYLNEKIF